jgi:hypothetical protein
LGYVGTYLNIKKIHYTLLEDSLDSYKRIRENRPNYRYIFEQPVRFKLKRRFGIGVIPFGYSPLCDRVEVNDKSGIQIPLEKVVEKNRQGLFEKLSQKDKQSIFSLFFAGENDLLLTKGNSVLILTEPFALTNRLPGKNAQIALYRDIIREYGNEKKVYIKPHPRDDMDYRDIFKAAVVLPKNVPMEVLNFSDSFKVDTSVTVTSSAIYGITCDRDKIYLGADFLKKYRL